MSALNAFLDKQGLTHYDSKLKTVVAGQMTIEGRTITLKSVSGATLATVTMPQTIYELATAQKDGLMSMGDFAKLQGIAAQATKVENSETNGNIQINDVETPVYVHPTVTAGALGAGLYKITTDGNGHVTLGTKVVKGDITALGIPAQDTTYGPATADAAGLMSAADFTKLQGVAVGAQVNVIEKVSVNGGALPVSSKGVNIDLTPYALKTDIASAVNYKGSVENYAALPTKDVKAGDMYNVETADPDHQIDAGMNVVWNGTSWDPMAPMITMTGITNEEIDALFA